MPVALSDVTVVVIDSVEPALVRFALEDTLQQIEPADALVFSDVDPRISGVRWIEKTSGSYDEAANLLWYQVPAMVRTSHFLVMQWDGWVLDGEAWEPGWLNLDYIGAPWWHGDGHDVGNGGFSLRSTELARWVAHNPQRYPIRHPEDVALCRAYRRRLETDGFRWATMQQAERFAFERTTPRPTFGFHGVFNFSHVLEPSRCYERFALAGKHARSTVGWREVKGLPGTCQS